MFVGDEDGVKRNERQVSISSDTTDPEVDVSAFQVVIHEKSYGTKL